VAGAEHQVTRSRPGAPDGLLEPAPSPEERRRILEARAEAIATVREVAAVATVPVVAFAVGGGRYAVAVAEVLQILDAGALAPLPAAPPWLLGAAVARSRVVPVLDLRQLLGTDGGGLCDLAKILVVEHDGEVFGLAAEAVEGQVELPRDGLTSPAEGPFAWIAPDRLAVLDLGRLGAQRAHGG
jgi:purine-binding chemotaxis protein CheW